MVDFVGIARYREPSMILVVWSDSTFDMGLFEALLTDCGLGAAADPGLWIG